jgi:hypothetical protein
VQKLPGKLLPDRPRENAQKSATGQATTPLSTTQPGTLLVVNEKLLTPGDADSAPLRLAGMAEGHFSTGHHVIQNVEYARAAQEAYRSDLQTGEIIEESNLCVSAVYCAL